MIFKMKDGLFEIIMVVAIAMFSILGVFTENTNARENENLEEIALMEDSLELIYEKGVVTNEKGYFLGYDREVFETVFKTPNFIFLYLKGSFFSSAFISIKSTNVSRSAEKENPSKNKGLKFVISNTSKTASAIIANPIYLVIG